MTNTKYLDKSMKRILELYEDLPKDYQEKIIDQIKYNNILSVVEEVKKTGTIHFGDLYAEVMDRQQYFNMFEGFKCGLTYFDKATMGFRPGEMIIIAGPSNFGKTMLALNVVASAIAVNKKRVLIISMEMTALEIASRVFNMIDASEHEALMENLIIQTELAVSAKHIDIMIRRLKPDLVMVDHIQFLANQELGQEYERVNAAMSKLKRMTIDHAIPIIVISHVAKTRSGEGGKATAADLKGTSSIEQDCDIGFMINRPTGAENIITITCFKHRTKRPFLFHKECELEFDGVRLANKGRYILANEVSQPDDDDGSEESTGISLDDLPLEFR